VPAALPDVLARVNGEEIGRADLEKAIRNVEQGQGAPLPASDRDRIYRGVLDELIGYRLLIQETRNRKVAVPDGDVDARMKEFRSQFTTPEAYTQALAERKMTENDVRAELRNDLLIGQMLRTEVEPKILVSEAEVAAFYERNPRQFQTPEQVRASHILVRVPAGTPAEAKTAALQRATTLLKSAKSGSDFAALAREHSQDTGTAARGGDLGFFPQGQMVGPFNDAAFRLGTGQISDIVETEFGYHIIKVVDRQPPRAVPLAEVRGRIEEYLQNVNRQRITQAFVQSLRSRGKVEVFI
jgi:peptidyl-prolyl cis-trans isomerase C